MEVHKTLIAETPAPQDGQHLQLEASADLEEGCVRLTFRTVQPDGTFLKEHGTGLVKYEDADGWLQEWSRVQYMVQTQIDLLKQKLQTGSAHKLLRGIVYKLFKALVSYSRPYQGMEEVILDGSQAEATAKVRFQTKEEDGNFFCAPYWIDSLAHLSGFIVNGTDVVDSSEPSLSHMAGNPFGWQGSFQQMKNTRHMFECSLPQETYLLEMFTYSIRKRSLAWLLVLNFRGSLDELSMSWFLRQRIQRPRIHWNPKVAVAVPSLVTASSTIPPPAPISSSQQQETLPTSLSQPRASPTMRESTSTGTLVSRIIAIIAEETDLSLSSWSMKLSLKTSGLTRFYRSQYLPGP